MTTWRKTTVGEFCPFKYGKALPDRNRKHGQTPVVSSAGVVGLHVEPLVDGPGIVVGRKGTVGSVTYVGIPFWAIDTAFYVEDIPAERDLRFTYYLLKSLGLPDMNSDSAVPGLNRDYAHAIELTVPDVDTQRVIGGILGSIDEKIELSRSTNQTQEAIAKAIFRCWFIDFEPVLAKANGESTESISTRFGLGAELVDQFPASLVETEQGPVPKGWMHSTLGEQASRFGGRIQTGPFGSQLHASDYVNDGVPVVMPQDLVDRRISTSRIARVTDETAFGLSRHRLEEGDVVYSRRGDVERHALVSRREVGWLCGTGCLMVRLGTRWPSQAYLSEALDERTTRDWIVRHAVGATMPNLNTAILSKVPILMPSDRLLHHFESVVATHRQHQEVTSATTESLASLRDHLLPKLLSGEMTPDSASGAGR